MKMQNHIWHYYNSPPLKCDEKITTEIGVMQCFTHLCKILSGVNLYDRISLNIAILVEHAQGKQ